MHTSWLISDHHLFHENIIKFTDKDGKKLRNFDNINQMHDYMIEKHNSVVKPQDKVNFLGDVCMNANGLYLIKRFNGKKRLIVGNHDNFKMRLYLNYFEDIYSSKRLDKFILTHIPIHEKNMEKQIANIHGHVHNNVPALFFGPKYYNVSCEVLDYTPISLEQLIVKVKEQQDNYGK